MLETIEFDQHMTLKALFVPDDLAELSDRVELRRYLETEQK